MPKKDKARKKKTGESSQQVIHKDGVGQMYAVVVRMLGGGKLTARCEDGKERLCNICGKLRNRRWINVDDVILIGLRDFQDDKADVILGYSNEESRQLRKEGQLKSLQKDDKPDADEKD